MGELTKRASRRRGSGRRRASAVSPVVALRSMHVAILQRHSKLFNKQQLSLGWLKGVRMSSRSCPGKVVKGFSRNLWGIRAWSSIFDSGKLSMCSIWVFTVTCPNLLINQVLFHSVKMKHTISQINLVLWNTFKKCRLSNWYLPLFSFTLIYYWQSRLLQESCMTTISRTLKTKKLQIFTKKKTFFKTIWLIILYFLNRTYHYSQKSNSCH